MEFNRVIMLAGALLLCSIGTWRVQVLLRHGRLGLALIPLSVVCLVALAANEPNPTRWPLRFLAALLGVQYVLVVMRSWVRSHHGGAEEGE